ncbi:hypothetical protein ACTG9Q_32530 [Actinokineospora sp. 24-640]
MAEDDPTEVSWMAEWGLRDDSMGGEDLAEFVATIVEDARRLWSDRYKLTIEWTLDGDPLPGGIVQDAVTAAGVTLPTTVS